MTVLSPKKSAEFIAQHSTSVKVINEGIEKLAADIVTALKDGTIDCKNFSQNTHHPKPEDPTAVNWIFLVDTLNFCFWTAGTKPKWRVDQQTGYFALCAAINRAQKEGIDITNPNYYSSINKDQLQHIFRSDDGETCVPLLEERLSCLHQVGAKLLEKYDGNFENCVRNCGKSAKKLLHTIVSDFVCFRDEAEYHGHRVSIYKRAQILVGDIWSCFSGEGLGEFNDIEEITMFADYRVPQVLVHYGCMEYSTDLMELLKNDTLLKNGCEQEIEIRGISIYVVEKLKEILLGKNDLNIDKKKINSILLDHFLWDYRRKYATELEYIPFHKVLCIYY